MSIDTRTQRHSPNKRKTSAKIAFVVNSDRAFLTHRSTWATGLQGLGYEVHVLCPDTGYADQIKSLGFHHHKVNLGRESVTPREAALGAIKTVAWLGIIRPSYAFLVQTAAYTLGWPAALFLRRTKFVRVAGGAGRALAEAAHSRTFSSRVVIRCLRLSSRLSNVFSLFQLDGNLEQFSEQGLTVRERSAVIPGTGIDTSAWAPLEKGNTQFTVGFASRLYAEKGVREFAELADRMRERGLRFVVVGAPDDGVSSAVTSDEIEGWVADGRLEWWGHRDNMAEVLPNFDVLVFPSVHPEGTPRTLIEAAACGVPAIASDQEGCRAVVIDEVTGWIVDPYDINGMQLLVAELERDRTKLETAASAARARAVDSFAIEATLSRLFAWLDVRDLRSETTKA